MAHAALFGCASSAAEPVTGPTSPSVASTEPAEPAEPTQPARDVVVNTSESGAAASLPNATATSAPSEPTGASKPEAGVLSPLPAGSKVLHVGDSFAGALGVPLGRALEAAGVRSVLKHTDASYLTTWAWEGQLQKHLDHYQPDLVLVTLGANELAITEPEQRARAIKKIVATIGARPCVWIAIPLWKGPHNGLLEVIRQNASPCVYMDTNALMNTADMPRISDGIHPTAKAREEWAEVVVNWLQREREPNGARPWTFRPSASTAQP